jgi:hypothetical protein
MERRNRVHPHHRPEGFWSLRHLIITFHDETIDGDHIAVVNLMGLVVTQACCVQRVTVQRFVVRAAERDVGDTFEDEPAQPAHRRVAGSTTVTAVPSQVGRDQARRETTARSGDRWRAGAAAGCGSGSSADG